MSELPKGWACTQLCQVCVVQSGYGFPERLQGKTEGDLPFYKVRDISEAWKRGEVLLDKADHYLDFSQAQALKAEPIPPGTTVLAKIGAAIGLNRRVMLTVPSLIDNNVMGLVPGSGIVNAKFLFYFACTLRLMDYAQATTVPSVRKTDIEAISIPVAPLSEQSRIVAEIEKQFTRLDAATAALKRVQANLKRYRASVLKAACEGRLVPTEAELARKEGRDYEPAEKLLQRILRERRARWEADTLAKMQASGKPPKDNSWKQKYKAPSAPDTTNLPTLPEGWCWTSFDQLIVSGPQNGLYKSSASYGSGERIVRIDDFQNDSYRPASDLRILRLTNEEEKLYSLAQGDILINRVNSPSHLGKCIATPSEWAGAVFESNMMRMQISSLVSIDWLMNYLHSNDGRALLIVNAKWAVNQASINQEDVKSCPIPLPPFAEQVRASELASRNLAASARAIAVSELQEIRSSGLRQSILSAAFTGQLVAQDPTDEPASALLARIRAERSASSKPSPARRTRKEPTNA